MASVKKFTASAVSNILRHDSRAIQCPSNTDINFENTFQNYSFLDDPRSAYQRYLDRKSELYCYNRKDVKTLFGWIVTKPKDLPCDQEQEFFRKTFEFISNRYGEKNIIAATVHRDESTPHLHVYAIPAVPDLKHGGEKICANDVITREDLRSFHPNLQEYLKKSGVDAHILTGVTSAQGGNRTVREMKRDRKIEVERTRDLVWRERSF